MDEMDKDELGKTI